MTKDHDKECCPENDTLLPKAEAVTLVDLVDYAPGAVVSRTMAGNDAGTVTLFAFDAGQELSEHSAPFDALVHVLDGAAEFTVGRSRLDRPGTTRRHARRCAPRGQGTRAVQDASCHAARGERMTQPQNL